MRHPILLLLLLLSLTTWAQQPQRVPAYPGVIERIQPNGDTLHIYLRGDERHHWAMTTDGWQIETNRKGWIYYTKQGCKRTNISRKVAHNADKRTTCEQKWLNKKGVKR